MSHSTTMTVRLDEATLTRLEKLARATERTKAYLANKAIEDYLANQEWQVQAIKEAVAEADKKDAQFIEHSQVVKKVHKMISRRHSRSSK
jgi:RHH-type transcriptional regulator, rel operon repressor / antitoxin RelB